MLDDLNPDFFYVVNLDEIEGFDEEYNALVNCQHYEAFVARYGQRRTNLNFWQHADWFNHKYSLEQSRLSGIFNLNLYQNH
ncbi:MAG: fatty acid cis/trans isomerase [Arenicellales bacterium]